MFKEIARNGVGYVYGLARKLKLHFETVRKILEDFKAAGIIELSEVGQREAKIYTLTSLGWRVLELLKYVEVHGAVKEEEVKRVFPLDVLKAAVNAGLLENKREVYIEHKLILDPPLQLSRETVFYRCAGCGENFDITGYPDCVLCPYCGRSYVKVSKRVIPKETYLVAPLLGGFIGALADRKNRVRGAVIGASLITSITAMADILTRQPEYECKQL